VANPAVETLYTLAYNAYEVGHGEKALDAFRELIVLAPFETRFWMGFAASAQILERYEEALRGWAYVALLEPEDKTPHLHAAECLTALGQHEEAEKALQEASCR